MMGAGTLSNQIMSCSKNFMRPSKCSYGSREAGDQASLKRSGKHPPPFLIYHALISGPM